MEIDSGARIGVLGEMLGPGEEWGSVKEWGVRGGMGYPRGELGSWEGW